MNKLAKYWNNVNLLVIVGIMLMLPFIPAARMYPPSAAPTNVLSAQVVNSAPQFSKVIASALVEATFSAKESTKSFEQVIKVSNSAGASSWYKVSAASVDPHYLDFSAVFSANGKDIIRLAPGESSFVTVKALSRGTSRQEQLIITVLN